VLVQKLIRKSRIKRLVYLPKIYFDAYRFYRMLGDKRCVSLYWAFRSVVLLARCKKVNGEEFSADDN
jgi:hypothetical protein